MKNRRWEGKQLNTVLSPWDSGQGLVIAIGCYNYNAYNIAPMFQYFAFCTGSLPFTFFPLNCVNIETTATLNFTIIITFVVFSTLFKLWPCNHGMRDCIV